MRRGWSRHHSLSLPTGQPPQLNYRGWPIKARRSVTNVPNCRAGPQPGGPLCVPDAWHNREGPQARAPTKCLNRRSYRKNTCQRGLLITCTRGLKKTLIRPYLLRWRQSMSLHTGHNLGHLHPQPSLGQSCHRQKMFCVYARGYFSRVQLFATLWTVTCQASLSGGFSR